MTIYKLFFIVMILTVSCSMLSAETADEPILVRVTDTSANSIVSFSGSVQFKRVSAPVSAPVKNMIDQNGTVVITNKSEKDILALVATIKVLGPEGIEQPRWYQHDFFFKAHSFPPNTTQQIEFHQGSGMDVPQQQNEQPHVNAELLFVQFEDGTSVGDPTVAADMLSQRKEVETYLSKLKAIYETQGKDAFALALAEHQKPHTSVGAVSHHLSMLNEQSGPDAVYQDIKDRLMLSSARAASGKFEAQ